MGTLTIIDSGIGMDKDDLISAIVPRLLIKSSLFIPIPESIMVNVLSFLLGIIFISILGFLSKTDLLVRDSKRTLSHASDAFEINSLRNISLFEYKAFIIKLPM